MVAILDVFKLQMYEIELANSPHSENSNEIYLNYYVLMIFKDEMLKSSILLCPDSWALSIYIPNLFIYAYHNYSTYGQKLIYRKGAFM